LLRPSSLVHHPLMTKNRWTLWLVGMLATVALLCPCVALYAQAPVKYREGTLHGFLALRAPNGDAIADGDLTQVVKGDRVTAHLVFHFKDGSANEETSVYSERGTFRLLSYHLVQKGPAFKTPMDVSVDCSTGQVTVHYADDKGTQKVITETLKLPPDLANGLVPTILKNIPAATPTTTLSMLVATPKPRVVKLIISPEGEDSFTIAGSARKARRFDVKVDIGGAAGVVAPLVGKQPPDTHIWILEGEMPAFLRSDGPEFEGGPIWRIELSSPAWPQKRGSDSP
jgi:hypothetical protein